MVVFFDDDRPALIRHMSSGTGEEWCEEVTISPGEIRQRGRHRAAAARRVRHLQHPGGVYSYYRRVKGVRQSALGGMWNPVYFNYGIAIHGALNVPLEPASHGCIRIPLRDLRDVPAARRRRRQVFVFDGEASRRRYGAQLPTFNWLDPDDVPRRPCRRRVRRPATR